MFLCFCVSCFSFYLKLIRCFCPLPHSTAEPLPLLDLCRRAARVALGRDRIHHIDSLPLPETLKDYLQYQWRPPSLPLPPTTLNPPDCSPSTKDVADDYRQVRRLKGVSLFTSGGVYPSWRFSVVWFFLLFLSLRTAVFPLFFKEESEWL